MNQQHWPNSPPLGAPQHTPERRKLPNKRGGMTHAFYIAGHKGYLRTGEYEDGRLGEIFLKMAKEGSTISGFCEAFATAVSIGLQYGVPLEVLAKKFIGSRFEPSGLVADAPEHLRTATSVLDYVFRWLMETYDGRA